MKKIFFKKCVSLLLLLFLLAPSTSLAELGEDHYKTEKENKNINLTTNIVTKIGSSTIINRSDKDFFVPNNTAAEYTAWSKNAPNYVTVSVCGDGVCSEGEDNSNCPKDCLVFDDGYCGDGICSYSNVLATTSPATPFYTVPKQVCESKTPWQAIAVGATMGAGVGCFTGALLGCGVGAVLGGITGLIFGDNYVCNNVNNPVYEITVRVGEVYATSTAAQNPYGYKQTGCKADCMPPSDNTCGVCGYDQYGNLCPNYCSNRNYNMINCQYVESTTIRPQPNGALPQQQVRNTKNLKKYLTASEALAFQDESAVSSLEEGYYYDDYDYYTCDYGTNNSQYLCPAGYYCEKSGGLKPGTALAADSLGANNVVNASTQTTCPAGYFCPEGSYYPRPCPINTFSTGNAAKCTACLPGTSTLGLSMSISESACRLIDTSKDAVCNSKESVTNSYYDCPDSSHIDMFKGDGRCSGIETMANSPDCKCGDGVCNNSETYLSCLPDCGCLDNVCGTYKYSSNWTKTVFPETKTCKSYGNIVENKSICRYMNNNETCGDGVCDSGEGLRYIEGKNQIVCPLDCHCGDGWCSSLYNENWDWTTNTGTCKADCLCGNGTCDSGESSGSCVQDCHCGNRICDYGENFSTCSGDCRCGNNVCDSGENSSNCFADCATACNQNLVCDDNETMKSCPKDCKYYMY